MIRHQENPGRRQTIIFLTQPLIKLNKLDHKSIIGTSDASPLLDKALCFFIIITIGINKVSNNKSNRTWNSLDAMYKNISSVGKSIVNIINNSVK